MDRLPIVVNLLKGEDAPRWDDFVRRCPQATFFHLSAWRDLMEEVFDHRTFYLYAERAGDIVGVLPLAEVRSRLFGHALVSLPFCVYGGIATAEDAGPETLHALESKAETLAQALGVQHLEYRNLQPRHEEWPRQAELYVTFRKEILPEVEANLLAIPRKQRAMVRKGIKNALVSEVDETVDRFFALYADNVLRHGTPALPKRFFEQLKERFGEAAHVNVTAFNRVVLLTGEISDEAGRSALDQIAAGVPNVRGVTNEVQVAGASSLTSRGNDAVVTSKVKARFVDDNGFSANHVKVVTEAGTVFLMGLVTREEADQATEIARTTSGVRKVVRVFEYITAEEARNLQLQSKQTNGKS